MSNPNHFDLDLQHLVEASVDKSLKLQVVDEANFESLYSYLCRKSEDFKSESTLSKQVVGTILRAHNVLEENGNIELGNKFMYLLGLMVISESATDRKSGKPRIM